MTSDARFHSKTVSRSALLFNKLDCDDISFQDPRYYHREEWRSRSNRENGDSLPKGRAWPCRRKGNIVRHRQPAGVMTDQGDKVEYCGVNFIDTYFRQDLPPIQLWVFLTSLAGKASIPFLNSPLSLVKRQLEWSLACPPTRPCSTIPNTRNVDTRRAPVSLWCVPFSTPVIRIRLECQAGCHECARRVHLHPLEDRVSCSRYRLYSYRNFGTSPRSHCYKLYGGSVQRPKG